MNMQEIFQDGFDNHELGRSRRRRGGGPRLLERRLDPPDHGGGAARPALFINPTATNLEKRWRYHAEWLSWNNACDAAGSRARSSQLGWPPRLHRIRDQGRQRSRGRPKVAGVWTVKIAVST